MADEFKQELDHRCSIGGTKCHCCNSFDRNGQQRLLRRQARRAMKQRVNKEIARNLTSPDE